MLAAAYAAHPERFPTEVWINLPKMLVRAPESSNPQRLSLAQRPPPRSLSSIAARSVTPLTSKESPMLWCEGYKSHEG